MDIAQNVKPDLRDTPTTNVPYVDTRLEQLRALLLGREIEILSRLTAIIEDPEQLATAVGRILPTAFAQASDDTRLGQIMAPALEKATQSSIRSDPRTLVNILYPLIVPAIRKSIGETIDQTFQSLNETLKYSLTWRGLRWRWEAWRTGRSFAEVVLNHTLVYQVEHVFLIHRHTGLLISHVAAENAASQDPQLVSSMLSAIQDFVRDSFSGAEHQGLDTLRLGDLSVWSEPGPFATLVAVIRGKPPEELHETLRQRAVADPCRTPSGAGRASMATARALRISRPNWPSAWRSGSRRRGGSGASRGCSPSPHPSHLHCWCLGRRGSSRRWQDDRRWQDYVAATTVAAGYRGHRNGLARRQVPDRRLA